MLFDAWAMVYRGESWTAAAKKHGGTTAGLKRAAARIPEHLRKPALPGQGILVDAGQAPALARDQRPAEPPRAPAAPNDDIQPLDENEDMLVFARRLLHSSMQRANLAQANGETLAATREAKNTQAYASLVARIERERQVEQDMIRISKAELDRIRASLREKLETATSRGVLCQQCNRELSADWGSSDEPERKPE